MTNKKMLKTPSLYCGSGGKRKIRHEKKIKGRPSSVVDVIQVIEVIVCIVSTMVSSMHRRIVQHVVVAGRLEPGCLLQRASLTEVTSAVGIVRGLEVRVLTLLGGNILSSGIVTTRLLSRQLLILAGHAVATVAGSGSRGTRNKVGDSLGNGLHHILPELLVFPLILLLESEALILAHICPAAALNLLCDVEQNLLGAPVAVVGRLGLADIAAGDIGGAINRESHAVGHLLAPALSVKPGVVPSLLAGINVNPTLLMLRIDLGPHMILSIPDPSYAPTHSTAQHAEAVGPLSDTTSPCLKQAPDVTVSGEPLMSATRLGGAPVKFNSQSATGTLLWCGCCHTLGDGRGQAGGTGGVVHPCKE